MNFLVFLFTILAALIAFPSAIDGKYVDGIVDTSKDMEFLARFVFEPDERGILWYEFKYPAAQCCYQLLLFNNDDDQWPYIRANEDKLTCQEKKNHIPSNFNGIVTLNTPYNCVNTTENGEPMLVCSGMRHFIATRPRWWFINVANCNSMSPTEGIHLSYKLSMTNGQRPLDRHFSADERFTLQTSIAFLVMYFLVTLTGFYYKYHLAQKRLLHTTYQLFFVSVCFQVVALTLNVIALGHFAGEGIEIPTVKTLGHIVSSMGDVLFVLMLMLVAKGYTITRGRISTIGSIKLAIFICLYAVAFVFLYAYEQTTYDPRDVMFIYDSAAGTGIIVLRCIGMIWLYYCVFFTVKNNKEKANFYAPFLLFFTMWFISEPIMIGIAKTFIPLYNRAKIVYGIYWSVLFVGHMIFLVMTRPAMTNEKFPFTIKTNQIGTLMLGENDAEAQFVNPFRAERTDESLTNIFVTYPPPKVEIPVPYVDHRILHRTASGPKLPQINNYVTSSLHAVNELAGLYENTDDENDKKSPLEPQEEEMAKPSGPNFSMFCVQNDMIPSTSKATLPAPKAKTTSTKTASAKTPAKTSGKASAKASAKTSGKASAKSVAKKRPGSSKSNSVSIMPTVALTARSRETNSDDFIDIPLSDLTISDV